MSGIMLMILANSPTGLVLNASLPSNISCYRSGTFGTVTASLTINNNGTYTSLADFGSGASGTWLTGGGTGANYDIRATVTSGSLSTGTSGSWLNLGSSQTWSKSISGSSGDNQTVVFTVEIRNATTLSVLTTSTVTLQVVSNI